MRRLPTTTVYLIYQACNGFLFRLMATIFSVFLILRLHLGPLELLLMGTFLEASYLLFELPTGVIADTVGRKKSVVIGVAGVGASFILLSLATTFWAAAFSQILFGIFATFESGADTAWLTDEIGEHDARPYYMKGEQVWQAAALLGIAGSVWLAVAFHNLRLPILVAGVGTLALALVLVIAMREERYRPAEEHRGQTFRSGFAQTLRQGIADVRAHRVLVLILVVAALHGASTEGFDRLGDFHFLKDIGLPALGGLSRVYWFGILDGVGLVLGIAAIQVVRKKTHLEGHAHVARILGTIDVVLILGVVLFAVAGQFWLAVGAFWLVGGLRNVREPIFRAWVNQGLDPRTRATINSMATQADAVGQAAGGPVLGLSAHFISVPVTLAISGVLRLPALALYVRAIRRGTVGTVPPTDQAIDLGT